MQQSIGAALRTRKAYGQSAERGHPRRLQVQQKTPTRPLRRIGGAAKRTARGQRIGQRGHPQGWKHQPKTPRRVAKQAGPCRMKGQRIAQRILLQEHLAKQADDIFKQLEDLALNEDEAKNLNCDNIASFVFDPILAGFHIENPTDFFKEHADNVDLVCNT